MNARPSARVDLYTLIHKGLRALLFDVAAAAARLDVERTEEVDAFVTLVERALEFLDEHAAHEDGHLMPVLHALAPAVEALLADDHRRLDALQADVAEAAYVLAATAPEDRPPAAAHLCRLLSTLTAGHLEHMNREETDANHILWTALDDFELVSIGERTCAAVAPGRLSAWMQLLIPAVNPTERLALCGSPPSASEEAAPEQPSQDPPLPAPVGPGPEAG